VVVANALLPRGRVVGFTALADGDGGGLTGVACTAQCGLWSGGGWMAREGGGSNCAAGVGGPEGRTKDPKGKHIMG